MKKMSSLFEVSELLAKKMTGTLDEEETNRFDVWLNSSERNQIFFKKIQDNQNFHIWNKHIESVDKEKAWKKIIENNLVASKRRKLSFNFLKYAAAILLPLCMGLAVYWMTHYSGRESIPISEITPGKRNAILVLSDGQKVNLGDKYTSDLKEVDGTIIEKKDEELNYAAQAAMPGRILFDELIVPRGAEYSLVLSDGTRVFMNSMSRLVFPVQFDDEKREVKLEGEAYFEVQKDESRPFFVQVDGLQVQVLGTSFNVKAYKDEPSILTTLIEGSVLLNTSDQKDEELELRPDQQGIYRRSNGDINIIEVDARQYVQWIDGKYRFTDQTLDEIMRTLARWYDFEYRYEDESIKTIRFEGGLNKYESIEPILDIINKTGKVKASVRGKEVIFSRI